ncbi:MAG: hypothetical protein II921_02875 [Treponema sp.]|nr:hypothetical protein [Treponema sp.]
MSKNEVKVRYGKELVTCSEEELSEMTASQLKALKNALQNNIEQVSLKKSEYINTNTESGTQTRSGRKSTPTSTS